MDRLGPVESRSEAFDIVAMQELFDHDQIDQVEADAQVQGYHFLPGPNEDVIDLPEIGIPDILSEFLGLPFEAFPDSIQWGTNSGLALLVSERLSDQTTLEEFQHQSIAFEDEGSLTDADFHANKGFTIDRIQLGGADEYIYVVNTHLFAKSSQPAIQESQLRQIAASVHALNDPRHPVLFLGDYNISEDSAEYSRMIYFLREPFLGDAIVRHLNDPFASAPGDEQFHTSDKRRNAYDYYWREEGTNGEEHKRIDYMFILQGTEYGIAVDQDELRLEDSPTPETALYLQENWYREGRESYLSDHYGLSAKMRLIKVPSVELSNTIYGSLIINGTDENDTISLSHNELDPSLLDVVGNGVDLGSFSVDRISDIAVYGHEGDDTLIVDASGGNLMSPGSLQWLYYDGESEITQDELRIVGGSGPDSISIHGATHAIAVNEMTIFHGSESVVVDSGGGVDAIRVIDVPETMAVTVHAGGGSDVFTVGGGNYFENIRGAISIDGGDGDDQLTIDDAHALTGVTLGGLVEDEYTLQVGMFQKSQTVTGVLGGSPITTLSAPLTFNSIADFTLDASGTTGQEIPGRLSSTININGVAIGTAVTVNGNDGADRFVIGQGSYERKIIGGPVTVNGGNGDDELVIDDHLGNFIPNSNHSYHFDVKPDDENIGRFLKSEQSTDLTFEKPTFSEVLSFSDIETARLEADGRDSEIHVDATIADASYRLHGNDGKDEFLIATAALRSDVDVSGGLPGFAPGDSLIVDGQHIGTALHRASATDDHDADIVITNSYGSSAINFDGLEPVEYRNFPEVTFITPRSYDILSIDPVPGEKLRISGSSRHGQGIAPPGTFPVLALPTGFETLDLWNVGHVIVDASSNDSQTIVDAPWVYPPLSPVDVITVNPGAMNAHGLQSLEIKAGIGPNTVVDRTLESGVPTSAILEVNEDVVAGTQHVLLGTVERLQLHQQLALTTDATIRDANGDPIYRILDQNVTRIAFPDVNNLSAAVQGIALTVSEQSGKQLFRGAGLTEVSMGIPRTDQGDYELHVSGRDNSIYFASMLLPALSIVGDPAQPDRVQLRTDSDVFAGPQPEPPKPPEERLLFRGFDGQDELRFASVESSGLAETTAFHANLEDNVYVQVELLVEPTNPLISFRLMPDQDGSFPRATFEGSPTVPNSGSTTLPRDPDLTDARVFDLQTENLQSFTMIGSDQADMTSFTARADGGLVGITMPLERALEVVVTTDDQMNLMSFDGRDGIDNMHSLYGDAAFPARTGSLTNIELLVHGPRESFIVNAVDQMLTPSQGTIQTGNLTLVHDQAVTDTTLIGTDLTSRLSGDFTGRPSDTLRLIHELTGSTSKIVLDEVHAKKLEVTVKGAAAHDNTILVAEKNVVSTDQKQIAITGGDQNDKILLSKAGVESKQGSTTTIDSKGGNDTIVVVEQDNGQAAETTDVTNIVGNGGTKKVDLAKGTQTPWDQLVALDQSRFGDITQAVDPSLLKPIMQQPGLPKPAEGSTRYTVEIKNAEVEVITQDAPVEVAEFVGTGIAPTGSYLVCDVTSTADGGPGSLRAAIDCANAVATGTLAVVAFDIPISDPNFIDVDSQFLDGDTEPDVFVISPLTTLPALTRGNIVINGQSQHNLTGDTNPFGPEIVLRGGQAIGNGLELRSSDNHVHGLNIQQFSGNGILVTSDADASLNGLVDKSTFLAATAAQAVAPLENVGLIPGSYIDTRYTTTDGKVTVSAFGLWVGAHPGDGVVNDDWTLRLPGPDMGAASEDFSFDLAEPAYAFGFDFVEPEFDPNIFAPFVDSTFTVRLLSGDAEVGLFTFNAPNDVASFIGAWTLVPFDRVEVREFGGSTDNEFFGQMYIGTTAPGATGNQITGSYIGTNATGTEAAANFESGVLMQSADGNLIGGTTPGHRNIISGNLRYGVKIVGNALSIPLGDAATNQELIVTDNPPPLQVSVGNTLEGNYIGTTADGLSALANGAVGVSIDESVGNLIGGSTLGARNVISGNQMGVVISGAGSAENVVAGNYVGTNADGVDAISNGDGVAVILYATGNRIGGTSESERNVISGNRRFGVMLASSFSDPDQVNVVQGNYIGTDRTGMAALGNTTAGIGMVSDHHSIIGGSEPGAGNVISGNGPYGIWMYGGNGTLDARVQGNLIGTNADGTSALPNWRGISVYGNAHHIAHDVLIGGTDPAAGNVISGNSILGVEVLGENATSIVIQGNYIGTDMDGLDAIPNQTGVLIENASGVLVGGTEPGARNIISGNAGDGIMINGSAPDTKRQTFYSASADIAGWTGFGNTSNRNNFRSNLSTAVLGDDNFAAGGTFARYSTALGEFGPTPIAYYADPRLGGTLTLNDPLHADGDLIVTEMQDYDGGVIVGTFDRGSAEANVGRSVIGLAILEPSARQGSVGIRAAATIILANGTQIYGSWVQAPEGLEASTPYKWRYDYDPAGGAAGAGELVVEIFAVDDTSLGTSRIELSSAQRSIGVSLDAFGLYTGGNPAKSNNPNTIKLYIDDVTYTRVVGNTVQGNYVGTDADGMAALGNGVAGVSIVESANNLIGGSVTGARNVISGNDTGVSIVGPQASGNRVAGNYVGLAADGQTVVGVSEYGIVVQGGTENGSLGASETVIGGLTSAERNVISGNWRMGIYLAGTMGTTVQGNYLGTDWTGMQIVSLRTRENIRLIDDVGSLLGGTDPGAGNVIDGGSYGVYLTGRWTDGGTQGTRIQGNRIGTSANGEEPRSNIWGIYVDGFEDPTVAYRVNDILIGGTELGAGNLISGNQNEGIVVRGPNANGVFVQGNQIGTDIDGVDAVPNGDGILIDNASGVVIGGTEPLAGNLVSGNELNGIAIQGGSINSVQGNFVGTDKDGQSALGNGTGILVRGSGGNKVFDLTIGGIDLAAGNVISGNTGDGIHVEGEQALGIKILSNEIGTDWSGTKAVANGGHGILVDGGAGGVVIGEWGLSNIISGNLGDGIHIEGSAPTVRSQEFYGNVASLAGWTGFGNSDHRNGFDSSIYLPSLPGDPWKAGGTFARASTALGETVANPIAFYADPHLGGPLTLDDAIHATGDLVIAGIQDFAGSVGIEFFDRQAAEQNLNRSAIGLRILEPAPGTNSLRAVAALTLRDGSQLLAQSPTGNGLKVGELYHWRLVYDPDGGQMELGAIVVQVLAADGTLASGSRLDLTEASQRDFSIFDAFGLSQAVSQLYPTTRIRSNCTSTT